MPAGYSASLQTAASANNEAKFSTGAKTFGAPSIFGEISQQVIVGVVVAVALFFILPRLQKS